MSLGIGEKVKKWLVSGKRHILSSASAVRMISEDIAGILGSCDVLSILSSDWSIPRFTGFWLVNPLVTWPSVSVSPPSHLRRLSGVTIKSEMRQITWKLPTLGTPKYAHCEKDFLLYPLIIKVKERKRNIRYLNIAGLTTVKWAPISIR